MEPLREESEALKKEREETRAKQQVNGSKVRERIAKTKDHTRRLEAVGEDIDNLKARLEGLDEHEKEHKETLEKMKGELAMLTTEASDAKASADPAVETKVRDLRSDMMRLAKDVQGKG